MILFNRNLFTLKTIFIVFGLLFIQELAAQDTIARKSMITFNVIAPTYSQAPRWTVGYLRNITKRVWVGGEVGYGNDNIQIGSIYGDDFVKENFQIFEIRPSLYYDLRPGKRLKHLASVELYFIHHTDTFENDTYFDTSVKRYYDYDSADYKRIKYGFNINYNLMYNFGSRISLMQTIGFGLRMRNVSFTDVINKVEKSIFDEESDGPYFPVTNNFIDHSGAVTNFNFNLDFKLTYRFK